MTDITVASLTEATTTGGGVFDVLMRATKAHLEQEYALNRIRGVEYSTVYLGSLESTMRTALEFLLQKEKIGLEAQLLATQVLLAEKQLLKADIELSIAETQLEITKASLAKVPAEIALLNAQTAHTIQQTQNLTSEKLLTEAKTDLTQQQAMNAETENLVLQGQKCKLDAEYDVLLKQVDKTTTETSLLTQKVITERAQTTSVGIDADSVIGKQKALYAAQTAGFSRDAEQKAAKIMADTWNVRRTTDEGTVADSTNLLNDATIGRAITKMLSGVGA